MQNQTASERVHIGFFGLRNAGKSSLVNAVTGQTLSVVSDILGTTTDPVQKTMEILPIGPVVIIDTPGIDDTGELGAERVRRAMQVLRKTDLAVLVSDAKKGLAPAEQELITLFQKKKIPYLIAYNKSDLLLVCPDPEEHEIYVSAVQGTNIYELKEMLGKLAKDCREDRPLVSDLVEKNDLIVLVTPIDAAAPKGRLILPQQQVLRDVLDAGGIAVVTKETELSETLSSLGRKPKLVITDSQAFDVVNRLTPPDILLTSFSILFARYKGDLTEAVRGAARLSKISDGDRILISEGCTHHRQCGDIGTEKLPKWIRSYTKAEPEFFFTSGGEFPDDPRDFELVIHCGACMLNEREMQSRIERAKNADTPITNYGIVIAQIHGILPRSLSPFPEVRKILNEK